MIASVDDALQKCGSRDDIVSDGPDSIAVGFINVCDGCEVDNHVHIVFSQSLIQFLLIFKLGLLENVAARIADVFLDVVRRCAKGQFVVVYKPERNPM